MERITPNWSGNGSFSWWRRRWKWRWNCCKFTPYYLVMSRVSESWVFGYPKPNQEICWMEFAHGFSSFLVPKLMIFKEDCIPLWDVLKYGKNLGTIWRKSLSKLCSTHYSMELSNFGYLTHHHYPLPLSLLGHMVVCISLLLLYYGNQYVCLCD